MIIILGIECNSIQTYQNKSNFLVKYVPFSSHFNTRVSEKDIELMKSEKFLIVKNDSINNDSINSIIFKKVKLLEKEEGLSKPYDLRMECVIYLDKEFIKFYLDNKKNIIINGRVHSDNQLSDIILNNICRPYFSYYFQEEKSYWPNKSYECNDSIGFLNTFQNKKE